VETGDRAEILVAQGGILVIGDLEFDVVMCLPVLQGLVSINTKLVVSHPAPSAAAAATAAAGGVQNMVAAPSVAALGIGENEVNLLDFLYPSSFPQYYFQDTAGLDTFAGLHFPLGGGGNRVAASSAAVSQASQSSSLSSIKFKVNLLASPVPLTRLVPQRNTREDEHSQVFASLVSLATLGITSGTWVILTSESKKTKLAKLYASDSEDGVLSMSPLLAFNLGITAGGVVSSSVTVIGTASSIIHPNLSSMSLSLS